MDIEIPEYRIIKLNSFHPLCKNELGKTAINKFNYPPFIDASCRREPDFQNLNPSISALCRQGTFAPHLRPGDIIVYMTIGGWYEPYLELHHRLVAILQVEETYTSHEEGARAYERLGLAVPSNCMIDNNPPHEFDHTAGQYKNSKDPKSFLQYPLRKQLAVGERLLRSWDNQYIEKSKKWPCFIRTKAIYCNVTDPPPLFKTDFEGIFGKVPNTRTPNRIEPEHLIALGKIAGLNIKFGKDY